MENTFTIEAEKYKIKIDFSNDISDDDLEFVGKIILSGLETKQAIEAFTEKMKETISKR